MPTSLRSLMSHSRAVGSVDARWRGGRRRANHSQPGVARSKGARVVGGCHASTPNMDRARARVFRVDARAPRSKLIARSSACDEEERTGVVSEPASVVVSEPASVPTKAVVNGGASMDSATKSRLLLLCVPILWATYAPALRYVFMADVPPDPATLSFVRIGLAQLPFLPALAATLDKVRDPNDDEKSEGTSKMISAAIELGLYNAFGTAFQAWGLDHTSSTHSGFIMGSVNVLVPALATASGERVAPETWIACVLTFIGVVIIGLDSITGGDASLSEGALQGDFAALASASCYAGLTIKASAYAKSFKASDLMATKTLVMLTFMFLWSLQSQLSQPGASEHALDFVFSSPLVLAAIVYSAYVPGALANYIQLKGQAGVSASDAQLIYATAPALNAIVSFYVLGETLTANALVGGGIILAASVGGVLTAATSKEPESDAR